MTRPLLLALALAAALYALDVWVLQTMIRDLRTAHERDP